MYKLFNWILKSKNVLFIFLINFRFFEQQTKMKIQYHEDTKRFSDFSSYADAGREVMKAFDL